MITAKNVKLGYLQKEPQEFINADDYESWMTRGIPNFGDVIFTTEAPLANVAQIDTHEKLAFAQRIIVMQPRADKLNQTFLKYMLLSPDVRQSILDNGTGATVVGIKSKLLKKIPIPIPPLDEQQQIVAILDDAFAAIDTARANIERNIANAKELFQSKLNEIFSPSTGSGAGNREGWVEKKLGEIAEFKNGLNFSKSSKGDVIKVVGVGDFQVNFFVPKETVQKTQIDGNLSEIYKLKDGDLLVVRSNGNPELIGRCMLAEGIDEIMSHSGFTIRVRPLNDAINPRYLCYFLKSTKAKDQLINSGSGISIKSLNQRSLSEIKLSIPRDKDYQERITKQLFKLSFEIEQLEEKYSEKLSEIDELRKSILQRAFAGELSGKNV